MKYIYYIFILYIIGSFSHLLASDQEPFNIILEPLWLDLEGNTQRAQTFGGKWILAGSITFKKKAKDTVHLSKLYLQWQGKKIENLIASLYRKNDENKFLPIQANLVCDGIWNRAQQTLMLNFEKRQTLGFSNTFYLVLTVPDTLESILKKGSFNLISHILPEPFKVVTRNRNLSLTHKKISPKNALVKTTIALN